MRPVGGGGRVGIVLGKARLDGSCVTVAGKLEQGWAWHGFTCSGKRHLAFFFVVMRAGDGRIKCVEGASFLRGSYELWQGGKKTNML